MKSSKSLTTTFLALSICGAFLVGGCQSAGDKSGSSQHTPSNSEKQPEVGMTKDQVVALYGKTDNMLMSNTGETWIYNLNMGEMFIPFNFGYRPKTRIVNFGQDGRVVSWSYSK